MNGNHRDRYLAPNHVTNYQDQWLHQQAFEFAAERGLKATYHSHYLALAHRLGIEFWTGDKRLVRAVQAELPWVHWYGGMAD